MKRATSLGIVAVALTLPVAVAWAQQPAAQPGATDPKPAAQDQRGPGSGPHGGMMGGGMPGAGMGGMHHGGGMMGGHGGMHGMGMGRMMGSDMCGMMMGHMGMLGEPGDPKAAARMLMLRGDMLRAIGEVLLKHGAELEKAAP